MATEFSQTYLIRHILSDAQMSIFNREAVRGYKFTPHQRFFLIFFYQEHDHVLAERYELLSRSVHAIFKHSANLHTFQDRQFLTWVKIASIAFADEDKRFANNFPLDCGVWFTLHFC